MNEIVVLFIFIILMGIGSVIYYYVEHQPYESRCEAIGGTIVSDSVRQCWNTEKGIRLFPDGNR